MLDEAPARESRRDAEPGALDGDHAQSALHPGCLVRSAATGATPACPAGEARAGPRGARTRSRRRSCRRGERACLHARRACSHSQGRGALNPLGSRPRPATRSDGSTGRDVRYAGQHQDGPAAGSGRHFVPPVQACPWRADPGRSRQAERLVDNERDRSTRSDASRSAARRESGDAARPARHEPGAATEARDCRKVPGERPHVRCRHAEAERTRDRALRRPHAPADRDAAGRAADAIGGHRPGAGPESSGNQPPAPPAGGGWSRPRLDLRDGRPRRGLRHRPKGAPSDHRLAGGDMDGRRVAARGRGVHRSFRVVGTTRNSASDRYPPAPATRSGPRSHCDAWLRRILVRWQRRVALAPSLVDRSQQQRPDREPGRREQERQREGRSRAPRTG